MKIEELKITQKILDMMAAGYNYMQQYPKSVKYSLCTDIRHAMDVLLERALEAEKKYYKKTTYRDLDIANAKLKSYLRISNQLGYLKNRPYEIWSRYLVEIGNMIGGLIKSEQNNPKQ